MCVRVSNVPSPLTTNKFLTFHYMKFPTHKYQNKYNRRYPVGNASTLHRRPGKKTCFRYDQLMDLVKAGEV
jgi:hypothetical protein